MSRREQLAEVIRDEVGVWRTPLEAADAILGAVTTTEWQFLNPEIEGWAGALEAAAKYLQKDHGYLIRSRQVTAWEVAE